MKPLGIDNLVAIRDFGTLLAYEYSLDTWSLSNMRNRKTTMNAQILAEIGSWVAIHSATLIYGTDPQPPLVAKAYWTASKCRLQRWASSLKLFERDLLEKNPDHNPWPAIEIVVQEILVSELLTRVFSSAMIAHDFYHQSDELHGLAHGIHVGHIEAKNRALRIMLKGQSVNEDAFDRMNGLRRRIERWTDLFLAQLPVCDDADPFAFDVGRLQDYRLENRQSENEEKFRRNHVFVASLASDLNSLTHQFPANPELNRRIAAGVISCFPADRFDSLGLPKSARMVWVEKTQDETQILIDELIGFDTLNM